MRLEDWPTRSPNKWQCILNSGQLWDFNGSTLAICLHAFLSCVCVFNRILSLDKWQEIFLNFRSYVKFCFCSFRFFKKVFLKLLLTIWGVYIPFNMHLIKHFTILYLYQFLPSKSPFRLKWLDVVPRDTSNKLPCQSLMY